MASLLQKLPALAATEAADREERLLETMTLIRAVEERLLSLFSQGKLYGTTHTCIGQESCAVAVVGALDHQRDSIFSTHRCHGHYLAYTDDPDSLIAEIMGRETGTCRGRGGSQHLCVRNFYSNGVQGGILPIATGVALAEKRRGSGAIAVCFLGDGTLGEGIVYETLNLASLWSIPILFVLEHNRYAQSTPSHLGIAGDVIERALAFGLAADRRAADDPVALLDHMSRVVAEVRQSSRPFLQVLDTYRLAAHSKGDDDRPAEEIEHHRRIDPLRQLGERIGAQRSEEIRREAEVRIDAAVDAAEAASHAVLRADEEAAAFERRGRGVCDRSAFAAADDSRLVVQILNQALHSLMEARDEVLLMGEDVLDPYGGAFKVSRGLSTRFPDRVLTTPISEAAILGVGTGLSLRGLRPVVEIMFGDFLALGADQILNHLAKFNWMYDEQVETPVVIRAAVGGHRGYGPTHSQSIEKMFFGMPRLVVVGVSLRHDPGELLRRAVAEDLRPVLFLEQKILYARRLDSAPPAGMVFVPHEGEAEALYPTGSWRPQGATADVTVVTYGAMTSMVEEAMAKVFDEDEILCEYVVPSQLAPLRLEPILDSVGRTGRLLVVEEGTAPWGFGAEVVAAVSEASPKPPRCRRVGAHHLPIPNARPAEQSVLPDTARIIEALRALMR